MILDEYALVDPPVDVQGILAGSPGEAVVLGAGFTLPLADAMQDLSGAREVRRAAGGTRDVGRTASTMSLALVVRDALRFAEA